MTIPSVTLLGVGEGFGVTVGALLGVGFFAVGDGVGFFFFGVGVGLIVFEAPTASCAIPGRRATVTNKKTLREICPICEMVSNQNFS